MESCTPLHYHLRYREPFVLRDGTRATLRLLHRDDAELLVRGFQRLSPQARYDRFFVPKPFLSRAEVQYLTDVDQMTHLAIVATRTAGGGGEDGLGIARAVRVPGEPEVYEGALTVIDDLQGRGLGGALARRLCAAAAERGARRVRFWVLTSNWPMRALLRRMAPGAPTWLDGGIARVDVAVDAPEQRSVA